MCEQSLWLRFWLFVFFVVTTDCEPTHDTQPQTRLCTDFVSFIITYGFMYMGTTRFRFLLLPVLLYKKSYIQIGQTSAGSPNRLKCCRFYFKSNFAMKDDYVEINGIPTRILTYGKWIDEPFKKNDELILCITGKDNVIICYQRLISFDSHVS